MEKNSKHFLLRMLVIISGKPEEKKIAKIFEDYHVPVRFQFLGKGTATSEFLIICGLSEIGKVITVAFTPRWMVQPIFQSLEKNVKIKELGKGIAFTVPINGAQSYLLRMLDEGQLKTPEEKVECMERNEADMKEEISYAMILVACNQGYSGEVMEASRQAGATGGTILKSRRQGMEEPMKFMGVSIQEEQEVISIIVPKSIKKKVMEALSEKCGGQTAARGIVLSLPVDEIIGLS